MNQHEQHPGASEESKETLNREGPRVYVASLSDYNNGILHGDWLDAAQEPAELQEGIDAILATSPTTKYYGEPAEEWAIHDDEGFGALRIGEYTGIERISRLAMGIVEHGPAFATWAAYVGETSDDLLEQFEDRYQGEWDTVEAYADYLLDELDAHRVVNEAPEWLQPYLKLDVEGFARDLEMGGDVITDERPDGGIWVWSGH
jgi:antirestriction protein